MKLLRILLKAALSLLALVVLTCLLGFGYLWINSSGTPQPIIVADGTVQADGVSSIQTMRIGGVDQTVILRGRSDDLPVLLVLHGGPGSPAYPFFRARNAGLEDDFIVAYWDQRGAGTSYDTDADLANLTIERLIADTAEVASQLAEQFEREKVFLLGHSWGGALAILTARDHPQLFHKVFAVSPVIAQYAAEQQSLDWLRSVADDTAPKTASDDLELPAQDASGADWLAYLGPQRGWLERSGSGTTHDPISLLQLVGMLAATPEYTIGNKWGYLHGTRASMQQLWPQIVAMDLRISAATLAVPLVIVHGAHDRVTPPTLSRAYFDALIAPEKTFHIFENSAHSALLEEPEQFNALLREHTGR